MHDPEDEETTMATSTDMFQNRKRYGSMHDTPSTRMSRMGRFTSFQNRKRYGSMHDSAPCGRRRNATKIDVLERDFRAAIFDCVFPETLSD